MSYTKLFLKMKLPDIGYPIHKFPTDCMIYCIIIFHKANESRFDVSRLPPASPFLGRVAEKIPKYFIISNFHSKHFFFSCFVTDFENKNSSDMSETSLKKSKWHLVIHRKLKILPRLIEGNRPL